MLILCFVIIKRGFVKPWATLHTMVVPRLNACIQVHECKVFISFLFILMRTCLKVQSFLLSNNEVLWNISL